MANKVSSSSKQSSADYVQTVRSRVVLQPDRVEHTHATDYPGAYPDIDDTWSLAKFKEGLKIDVISANDTEMEFDLIGVNAAVANTFRRIMIAEVPTMAIETCYIHMNTSIIPDETLAHRLGLIPIKADPRLFKFSEAEEDRNEENTIALKLEVKCERNPLADPDEVDKDVKYKHHKVYSGDLKFVPNGRQKAMFGDIRPVHDDILIAKLVPGQEMIIEMHCTKGVGKEHAKWSPVGTASYRLLPEIILKREFRGDAARRLQKCFSPGVIALDERNGDVVARVADARKDTMSREVFRHPDLAEHVVLQRVRDHFIFSVESTGALKPQEIVAEAIKIMMGKCDQILQCLDKAEAGEDDAGEDEEDGVDGEEGVTASAATAAAVAAVAEEAARKDEAVADSDDEE